MSHAQQAWRTLPAGTVKVNAVFGGASGGAAHPRRGSGQGFECGPELLDEMTATKAVHLQARPPAGEPIRFAGLLAAASRIGPDSTTAVAASLRDEPPRQPVIT
jgi:hypothetical protein